MKPTDTLTTLYSHNQWANLQLLEHCAQLTQEQRDTTITGTFGTIQDTLQHIVTAEQSYLYRISTGQPRPNSGDDPQLSLAEMMDSAQTTGAGLVEWAGKVQADETVEIKWLDGQIHHVPKTIILTQAINHATEHRAQIMAIMTQLGVEPPSLSSWDYFDQLEK